MNKQSTNQLIKLSHITIILSLLLIVGCGSGSRRMSITAPDLLHPVSMSSKVGVNPNQTYQEVEKFSGWFYGEKNRTNDIQEQMSEVLMKGPKRKAIKDMEIRIEYTGIIFMLVGREALRVKAEGSVIETQ